MRKMGILLIVASFFIFSFSGKVTTHPYPFPLLNFFPQMPIAPDNPVTIEGARLGRYLFYEPMLSSDKRMSCSGCHNQKAAFSDSPKQFSSGRNGTLESRNTMPLFNLAWYPAFFWDGRATSIEEQVFHPLRNNKEMNLQWSIAAERLENSDFYKPLFTQAFGRRKIDSSQISKAIAQFLRTLIAYQSKYDQVLNGKAYFTKEEYEGFILVNDQTKGDCLHCHTTDGGVLGTTLVFSNNGLDIARDPIEYPDKGRGAITGKTTDNGKFIVPSLRNLAFTAPYMHDGRFRTLEDVLEFYTSGVQQSVNIDPKMEYAHQGGTTLTEAEKKKIIAFLLTLSDSSFIANPEFSNPFGNDAVNSEIPDHK